MVIFRGGRLGSRRAAFNEVAGSLGPGAGPLLVGRLRGGRPAPGRLLTNTSSPLDGPPWIEAGLSQGESMVSLKAKSGPPVLWVELAQGVTLW